MADCGVAHPKLPYTCTEPQAREHRMHRCRAHGPDGYHSYEWDNDDYVEPRTVTMTDMVAMRRAARESEGDRRNWTPQTEPDPQNVAHPDVESEKRQRAHLRRTHEWMLRQPRGVWRLLTDAHEEIRSLFGDQKDPDRRLRELRDPNGMGLIHEQAWTVPRRAIPGHKSVYAYMVLGQVGGTCVCCGEPLTPHVQPQARAKWLSTHDNCPGRPPASLLA